MNKQNIDLKKFRLLQGTELNGEEMLVIKPDDDGFIRLRLQGATAEMGDVNWGIYRYFIVDMLADMDSQMLLDFRFEKAEPAKGEETGYINYEMLPTRRVKLAVDLEALQSKKFFLLTLPGMLKARVNCNPCTITEMNAVELYFHPGYSRIFDSITISEAYLCNTLPDMKVIGQPMVDEMGQWTQKNWGSKTGSVEELVGYLQQEYKRSETDNSYPEGWSRFGGWTDLKFDATGFFHTNYDGKRWWLVDPDGYAFFSNGMCYGSRMGVHGFVDKMENLFSWLPDPEDKTYIDAWTTADRIPEFAKRNGPEAGKNRKMFNFARANMIRAFGPDKWWDAWLKINSARLKRWGFNTIGIGVDNYSDERVMDFLAQAEIPFVWTLKEFPLTDELVFRDFPDVFSEQYEERSKIFAENQLAPFVGNPYMIGHFITNEPEWKFQTSVNIAERVFAHPERLASKTALIDILRSKYGSVDVLNRAWNQSFGTFEDLYVPFSGADCFSEEAMKDMKYLRAKLLEKYSQVPGDALRKVDPNHMNLGMRYSEISKNEIAGSEYFEVISFNCYYDSALPSLKIASESADMPCIVGEWHIGGADKGLLSCGLLAAATQEERGRACEYYMQGAMSHKNCVGIHYFEMNDQPLLGRFDGECMQHGVMDICNRPYDELIEHFFSTNHRLYNYVSGSLEPEAKPVKVFRTR
ncbi:MAG: Beta-galactosidase [Eubacterium sp.]|nr:Beta-galactosidase [Eubacterium sp.]